MDDLSGRAHLGMTFHQRECFVSVTEFPASVFVLVLCIMIDFFLQVTILHVPTPVMMQQFADVALMYDVTTA
jgi:hypothetical protein